MELRIMLEPQIGASYDQQLAIAQRAEQLGFGGFFRSDHFMAPASRDGLPGPTDAWATLAAIARETSTIRLGTMVTCATFRAPGLLAVTVAQVDNMSGGRVELGLGAGWNEDEHRAYGFAFGTYPERFAKLEEQLRILRGLWATPVPDRFSFSGEHYRLEDSPGLPKPTQQPGPPIIMGGAGHRRTPRLAAAHADEFNVPFHGLDAGKAQFERVAAACEAAGRDPATVKFSAALCTAAGADAREARRRAEAINRTPENVDLGGTPEELLEQIGKWQEAGAVRLYLQILDLDDLEHLDLIAAEVLPRV